MTVLGLIRHGVTDWNQAKRMQGQTDIPLNDEGRWQADRLASRLKSEAAQWDAIFSSDLQRAVATAESINQALQLGGVILDPRIRERSFGQAEGLTPEQRLAQFGEEFELRAGIESEQSVLDRGQQFLDELLQGWSGKHILIVSHGGFLKRFFSLLQPEQPDVYIDNASLTVVRQDQDGWRFELHNCTRHYREAERPSE